MPLSETEKKPKWADIARILVPGTGLVPLGLNLMYKKTLMECFAVMVPGTGFEPAHLAAYAPKAYVSTNSTIRA